MNHEADPIMKLPKLQCGSLPLFERAEEVIKAVNPDFVVVSNATEPYYRYQIGYETTNKTPLWIPIASLTTRAIKWCRKSMRPITVVEQTHDGISKWKDYLHESELLHGRLEDFMAQQTYTGKRGVLLTDWKQDIVDVLVTLAHSWFIRWPKVVIISTIPHGFGYDRCQKMREKLSALNAQLFTIRENRVPLHMGVITA